MAKQVAKTVSYNEIRKKTNDSESWIRFGDFGETLSFKDVGSDEENEDLHFFINCLKYIWGEGLEDEKVAEKTFTHVFVEKVGDEDPKSKFGEKYTDSIISLEFSNFLFEIQTKGIQKYPFSKALLDPGGARRVKNSNLGKIDKLTYESVVQHSLYKWFREQYIVGTKFENLVVEADANNGAKSGWKDARIDLGNSLVYVDPNGGSKRETTPQICVIFYEKLSIKEMKDKEGDFRVKANDIIANFLFRNSTNITSTTSYHTSLREKVGNLTKVCFNFNFAETLLGNEVKPDEKQDEFLLAALKEKGEHFIFFRDREEGDNSEKVAELIERFNENILLDVFNVALEGRALFLQKIDELAKEMEDLKQVGAKEAKKVLAREYRASGTALAQDFLDTYKNILSIHRQQKQTNTKFKGFNTKSEKEKLTFVYDDKMNFLGLIAEVGKKSKPEINTPQEGKKEASPLVVPFDSKEEKYSLPSLASDPSTPKLSMISDIFLDHLEKDFDTQTDNFFKTTGNKPTKNSFFILRKEFLPDLKLPTTYVYKFNELFKTNVNFVYPIPLIPIKSYHNFFVLSIEILQKDLDKKLTWQDMIQSYHYPELKVRPSAKKQSAAPDTTVRKKPGGKTIDLNFNIPVRDALITKYNCYDDVVDVLKKRDLETIYEFFFFKFPWTELLSRALLANRDRLERQGKSSAFLDCIADLDFTRILATFANLKAIWDNPKVLLSALPPIPTLPFFEYLKIVDYTKEIKERLVLLIFEALLVALQSLLGFAIQDLLNMCNLDLEDLNALANSRSLGVDKTHTGDITTGGIINPGDNDKFGLLTCDLNKLIDLSIIKFDGITELLEESFVLKETAKDEVLRTYFREVAEILDATELFNLLSGFPNENVLNIVKTLDSSKISTQLVYSLTIKRFFKLIGDNIPKDFCKKETADKLRFTADPCLGFDKDRFGSEYDNILKKKTAGLGDDFAKDYQKEITDDAISKLQEICNIVKNFANNDLFEASQNIPSLLSDANRKMIKRAVGLPFAAFEHYNVDTKKEWTNLLATPKAKTNEEGDLVFEGVSSSLYVIIQNVFKESTEELEKIPSGSLFYDLATDIVKGGSKTKFDFDGNTLSIGKLKVNPEGEVSYGEKTDFGNVGKFLNEEPFVQNHFIKGINNYLKGEPGFENKTFKTSNDLSNHNKFRKIIFERLITAAPISEFEASFKEEKIQEILGFLFPENKFSKEGDYFEILDTKLAEATKSNQAKAIGNLLVYKQVLKSLEAKEKKK